MSRNTVHEGWLTKSPPNRRIWRTRWRRRWFSLRQSGELPGQYFLDYYADRNCRRLKGTIDLDLCEQVDAGLRMERNSHAPFNPKIRGSVFTIQTQRRTYHLEADCESEMEKWVEIICRVCGLRSTSDAAAKTVVSPICHPCDDDDDSVTTPRSTPGTPSLAVELATTPRSPPGTPSLAVELATTPRSPPGTPSLAVELVSTPRSPPPATPPPPMEMVVFNEPKENEGVQEITLSCYKVFPSPPSKAAVKILEDIKEELRSLSAEPEPRQKRAGRQRRRSQSAAPLPGPSRKAAALMPGPSLQAAEPKPGPSRQKEADAYQNTVVAVSAMNENYECADGTGPYIPISECITGVRAQDEQRAFTFDPKNILMSTRHDGQQLFSSQSHFRLNSADLSENESNMSDEEEVSLHASHQNIPAWSVTKSFTKLSVADKKNGGSEDGPPVPPRPPKTLLIKNYDFQKDAVFTGPKVQEPIATFILDPSPTLQRLRVPRRMSQGAPASPGRLHTPAMRTTDDEEETSPGHASMQYCNLPSMPPAVDRALKPRHSSVSVGHINAVMAQQNNIKWKDCAPTPVSSQLANSPQRSPIAAPRLAMAPATAGGSQHNADEVKPDTLQYLDLDLHTSKPSPTKGSEQRNVADVAHGKSQSAVEADSAYKTVDFLKTEAFNITRQDAEASRSFQY